MVATAALLVAAPAALASHHLTLSTPGHDALGEGTLTGLRAVLLNRGYYSGVERGVRNVSLTNITKIADALGVPASELLARAEAIDGRRR